MKTNTELICTKICLIVLSATIITNLRVKKSKLQVEFITLKLITLESQAVLKNLLIVEWDSTAMLYKTSTAVERIPK
jgi:hypothetical protein